jgi:predicted enzyme related to lactoylglutathione lyase
VRERNRPGSASTGGVAPVPRSVPSGKICYVQIPAVDIERSADFYAAVFDWNIRRSRDGDVAFDDTTGGVSGRWITGRPPSSEVGIVIYVMVDSVQGTLEKIVEAGGQVVTPFTPQGEGEAYAVFRDPAGNIFGIGQQP